VFSRYDQNAVTVYVQHKLAGHLPPVAAARVQSALLTLARHRARGPPRLLPGADHVP